MNQFDFENLPTLTEPPPFFDEPPEARDAEIGLDADLKHLRGPARRKYLNMLNIANACKCLEGLPRPGESFHIMMRGNFHLWAIVPAILRLAEPAKIQILNIATLGFNRANAEELIALLNAGDVGQCSFICSTYYKSNETDVFTWLFDELAKRGCPMVAMRNHAKILLFKMTDGRCFVVESSANLRSCRNIEQLVLTQDRELLDFHRGWMEQMLSREHR